MKTAKKEKQSRGRASDATIGRQRTRRTIFLMCFDSRINELASCCQSARKRLRTSPPSPPPSSSGRLRRCLRLPCAQQPMAPAPFHIEFASIFPLVPISPTPRPGGSGFDSGRNPVGIFFFCRRSPPPRGQVRVFFKKPLHRLSDEPIDGAGDGCPSSEASTLGLVARK